MDQAKKGGLSIQPQIYATDVISGLGYKKLAPSCPFQGQSVNMWSGPLPHPSSLQPRLQRLDGNLEILLLKVDKFWSKAANR